MKNIIQRICAVNFIIDKMKERNDSIIRSLGFLKESLEVKKAVGETDMYHEVRKNIQEGIARMDEKSKYLSYLLRSVVILDADDKVMNQMMDAFAAYVEKTNEELKNELNKF